jgi:hypothetical protein
MKKSALLAIVGTAVATLVLAHAFQGDSPLINSASNPAPQLEPGGPGVVVDLRGVNLNRITTVQVLSGGQVIKDVTVTLGPATSTTRSFTFKAIPDALSRTGLALRISDGRQTIDIPTNILKIEVGPKKPINPLGTPDTTPRLVDTTKSSSAGPAITSFVINGGAASATANRVTLNIAAQNASSFRASENSAFTGAAWQTWSITAVPPFDLSAGNGTKTVYVQVKNPAGTVSPTVSDTITLNASPPPTRSEYRIGAGDAYEFSQLQGFKFSSACGDSITQEARISYGGTPWPGSNSIILKAHGKPWDLFGARCDFVLFDGRELKEGWVFKSYDAVAESGNVGSSYTVNERPTAGSRTIRFRIHLWCDKDYQAQYYITRITLEGPANIDWREAFK